MFLHEVVEQAAVIAPDAVALIDGERSFTFVQLHQRIARAAAVIASITEPADRVAVIGANHHGWIDLYYGVPASARSLVFLNHRLAPAEIDALISRSGASVIIGERSQLERLSSGLVPRFDWQQWEELLSSDATASEPLVA
jgi:fatty-acyl-CoA synthase